MYIRTILYTMISVGSLVAADQLLPAMTSQAQSSSSIPTVALISMPEEAEDPKVLIAQAQQFKFSSDYPLQSNIVELTKLKRTIVDNKVLEFRDARGDTLLHRAVIAEDVLSTELLLSWGVDVNVRNTKTGRAALHMVRSAAMLEKLFAYGADPDAMDIYGAIPYDGLFVAQGLRQQLHQATEQTLTQFCCMRKASLQQLCIWEICARKIDTANLPDATQMNIADHQRWLNRKLHTHLFDRPVDYLENLNILLSRGADPNSFYLVQHSSGRPMDRIIERSSGRPMDRIIERTFEHLDGTHRAVDSMAVIDVLLKAGMDLNLPATLHHRSDSYLHMLMEFGLNHFLRSTDEIRDRYDCIVKKLCAAGADLTSVNKWGQTVEQLFKSSTIAQCSTEVKGVERFKSIWQEVGVSLSVDENVDSSAPSCSSSDIHTASLPVDHAEHN